MRNLSARSLAGQFLVFQLLVVAVVLAAVAAVSVAQSTREFREVRGQRMIAVAENLASTPILRDRYADPFAAKYLAPDLDRAVALSVPGWSSSLVRRAWCGRRPTRLEWASTPTSAAAG